MRFRRSLPLLAALMGVPVSSQLAAVETTDWPATLASGDYRAIARAYADYMIEHGRDRYGEVHSPLFVTAINRKTGETPRFGDVAYPHVITKPYAPGLRRDHKMRPGDRTYSGSNPLEDLPLYRLLFRLSELTGDDRYATEANKSIDWFLANAQSPVTGLYSWGSHMFWDVHRDLPVYSNTGRPDGGYGGHEYNLIWPYWERNPEALRRFAHGIWEHQIADRETGSFSRHAAYHKHGPGNERFEFPRTASCYMDIWAREYGNSGDPEMKKALQTLLGFYRSLRHPETGAMSWCSADAPGRRELSCLGMNLFMATALQDAAGHVRQRDPDLADEMREFVRFIDDEFLSNDYDKILDVAGKGMLTWYRVADRAPRPEGMIPAPGGVDDSVGFPLEDTEGRPAASLYYLTPWFPGRSYAEYANLLHERFVRCELRHKPLYRRALLDVADIYLTIGPEVQFAQYPDNVADVVALFRQVYRVSGDPVYLHRADLIMKQGLKLFFDYTSPLPKISNFDDWYESSSKNESSVGIFEQMVELGRDFELLSEELRHAPVLKDGGGDGMVKVSLAAGQACFRLQYGEDHGREVFLTRREQPGGWRLTLSDAITRIPTAEEADKLNGRMGAFTGKANTSSNIAYGGFKDVPAVVGLTVRNRGEAGVEVRVVAGLHDTYHDNGEVAATRMLGPGTAESFVLSAPERKWIRHLSVEGSCHLEVEKIGVKMISRSELNDPTLGGTK